MDFDTDSERATTAALWETRHKNLKTSKQIVFLCGEKRKMLNKIVLEMKVIIIFPNPGRRTRHTNLKHESKLVFCVGKKKSVIK